jgi:hypothetical protein
VAIASTMVVDRQSGLISCDCTLGGKVYFDPQLGTVRFSRAVANPSIELRITYSPAFMRITNGGSAAYSQPTTIFDDHFLSDGTEWYNTTPLTQTDRTMFFFGKAADASASTTARPFMVTMRYGVRLPTRIATTAGGTLAGPLTITYTSGQPFKNPYQVDPANGRIYFTAADEDQGVQITYTGVDESNGNSVVEPTQTANVSYVLEQDETPVLIDTAINESSLYAFPDPFSYENQPSQGAMPQQPRPPLIWMFYTSTRNGGPDIYFQTIAPRLSPVVK